MADDDAARLHVPLRLRRVEPCAERLRGGLPARLRHFVEIAIGDARKREPAGEIEQHLRAGPRIPERAQGGLRDLQEALAGLEVPEGLERVVIGQHEMREARSRVEPLTERDDERNLPERLLHARRSRQLAQRIGPVHEQRLDLAAPRFREEPAHFLLRGGRVLFAVEAEQHRLAEVAKHEVRQLH